MSYTIYLLPVLSSIARLPECKSPKAVQWTEEACLKLVLEITQVKMGNIHITFADHSTLGAAHAFWPDMNCTYISLGHVQYTS